MKLPQTGGCLCGKIRYQITNAPQLVYTCHCTDCQHLTSSAFSIALAVADFRLTGDEPRPLEAIADSGRVKIRWVCPECGCWLFSTENPVTACTECGPEPWTIARGCARLSTFGSGVSSLGSCCPRAIKRSRRSPPRVSRNHPPQIRPIGRRR